MLFPWLAISGMTALVLTTSKDLEKMSVTTAGCHLVGLVSGLLVELIAVPIVTATMGRSPFAYPNGIESLVMIVPVLIAYCVGLYLADRNRERIGAFTEKHSNVIAASTLAYLIAAIAVHFLVFFN